MKQLKKSAAIAGLALAVLFGVTACGGNAGDSPAAGSGQRRQEADVLGGRDAAGGAGNAGGQGAVDGAGNASAEDADTAGAGMSGEYGDLDTSFNTYMEARFTKGETDGYIPLGDGQCVQIHEDEGITFAAVTPDRQRIVVLLKNDQLYVTDIGQKNKKIISESCSSSRVYPSDLGIAFQEEAGDGEHFLRYTFADETLVDLGACGVGIISANKTAAAGVSGDTLCLVTLDSDQVLRYPGVGDEEIRLKDLPDDGSTVIWTRETDQFVTEELYTLGADGTEQLLGDITARGMVLAYYSRDGKLALVISQQVGHLYIKDASGQWKRVELPGDLKDETGVFMTDAGLLHQVDAESVHYIYLRCGSQLCAVSPDGAVTVVQDSVRDFDIVDGTLYFSDTGKNIYAAALNGAGISESTLLLSGMDTFAVSPDGRYLYGMYVHSDDEKVRSLSVYPLQEENASETVLSENIYADSHVYLSADDASAYYGDDARKAGDFYYVGTLKVYRPDSGETETIDEDVYKNTFTNGKDYVLLSEYGQSMAGTGAFVAFHGDLMYRKQTAGDTDGHRFDWYYYDGEESLLMASDLVN